MSAGSRSIELKFFISQNYLFIYLFNLEIKLVAFSYLLPNHHK